MKTHKYQHLARNISSNTNPNNKRDKTMTEIKRIDLSHITPEDLEGTIKAVCNGMSTGDYKLAATFVYQNQLVMIFQK